MTYLENYNKINDLIKKHNLDILNYLIVDEIKCYEDFKPGDDYFENVCELAKDLYFHTDGIELCKIVGAIMEYFRLEGAYLEIDKLWADYDTICEIACQCF